MKPDQTHSPISSLKKQAKTLFKKLNEKDAESLREIQSLFSNIEHPQLMHCQHAIAVRYGFKKWGDIVLSTPTQLSLAITMYKIPLLTAFGIGIYNGHDWSEHPTKERWKEKEAQLQDGRQDLRNNHKAVESTIKWLESNAIKIKTLNRNYSSYSYKHFIEHHVGYITNGVFIAAAIIAGFPYKINPADPNVEFGISEKSVKKWNKNLNNTKKKIKRLTS